MAPHSSSPLRSRRALFAGIGALVAVVVGVLVAFAVATPPPAPTPTPSPSPTATPSPTPRPTRSPRPTPSPTPTPSPSPTPEARCPLDGEVLAEGVELHEPALAVQVENHPEARPARNLTRADMIIEGTVEGDTTRFTAIYLCDATEGMTGPVRSARYYNVDLWQDIHVLTVGFGASPGALVRFANAGMPYPNGLDGGWPWYARYGTRAAPHNLYVDLEGLRDGLTSHRGLTALAERVDALRPPFAFEPDVVLPDADRRVNEIEMWTNGYWFFAFTWNEERGAYLRSDQGVRVVDEMNGEPVAPTSVVVQRVTQETVFGDPDPGGNPRRLQHLVGSGEGTLYTRGRAYDLRWERPTAADGTTWTYAATGEVVVLPPGQVWLEYLPVEASIFER
jgi:Protein of unknown function (DUF3048) N-terminal domain/Protein of unknown function (DUF3048) C-terminal domain